MVAGGPLDAGQRAQCVCYAGGQMWNPALLRDRRFWAAVGAVALLIVLLTFWAVRSYQRAQARDALNAFAPFQSPPMELQFPRFVVENDASRQVLAAGAREGIWTLHALGGKPPVWDVRLTNQGQRWFSVVGKQVVATFKAGARRVTRVVALENMSSATRSVRFRFVWTGLHPGSVALGTGTPMIGEEYEGEALFFYEQDKWRILHWSAPEFEQAVSQFNTLQSP
jgi:hypothetical protein